MVIRPPPWDCHCGQEENEVDMGPDLSDMPITVAWGGAELQGGRGQ